MLNMSIAIGLYKYNQTLFCVTIDEFYKEEENSMNFEKHIIEYFQILDNDIDVLSNHQEGKLVGLPSWVHTTREITLTLIPSRQLVFSVVKPNNMFEKDEVKTIELTDIQEIKDFFLSSNIQIPSVVEENHYFCSGDFSVNYHSNPLAIPYIDRRLLCVSTYTSFFDLFSFDTAKNEALDFWNQCDIFSKVEKEKSYVQKVNSILFTLQSIIKRKAFLERKVHRFINAHRRLLLPNYKNCFFEHPLFFNGVMRKADFILERESGFPSMLIELESPVHKIFTLKKDLTAQANHACSQISEWVSFIDREPQSNTNGDFNFLSGPKERLVIIGRGLEEQENLINTKFTGTVIWTYELFIEEARRRLNDSYENQCRILDMPLNRPF